MCQNDVFVELKGGLLAHPTTPWTPQQVSEMLNITEELYSEDDPENPFLDYDGEARTNCFHIGFTAAAITQLRRELGVSTHIKRKNNKIESYTPEHTQY